MNVEVSSALDFIGKRSPDNGKREYFAVVVADEKNLRVSVRRYRSPHGKIVLKTH